KKNSDTTYVINAVSKLGIYYKKNNQLIDAFKYYNEAFKIFKIVKDSIGAGKKLLQMANIQARLGDYSGSKTTAIDGLKFIENKKDIKSLSGLYHIISVANREQKKYMEALKYNSLALNLGNDSIKLHKIGAHNILMFKNTKANILANQKKYQEALSIFSKLQLDSLIKGNKIEYARVLANLGHIKWLQNMDDRDSERLLLSAKKIREDIEDVNGLIASNIYLTRYYFDKDREKALYHAEEAYRNATTQNSMTSILEALGFIFELKDNTKEEAKVFNKVHGELQEINQSNREIYAVTKYENDKLNTENLILKAETAKKDRQKIIYLFSTILLALIGSTTFYLFRQRHRREKIRDVYNAEARISKKIHDELANDIYNVMVQVQNDHTNPGVLDKLEEIYNSTRDISRENNSFTTGEEYSAELEGMLSSYSSGTTNIIIKGIDDINWQTINPEKKIIVHRTLQELMVNMRKHSNAGLVVVSFKKMSKKIVITYADNGVGVKLEKIIYSNGLRNTENRIKTIGGTFIFDSEIGKGFKAKIDFPN
ncbi:tetratricopeptide repeat-containing sensor histidine kinase, partial [Aquimarina pacifica]|uniref:tetratricopeptide repeat-containing sensor histidine kinase n=1 Tax=Aquimarina pacifica TaxID=1296415 RepID=UPI0004708563